MKCPFVLVHGAWHGGWCWRRVVPLLRAAGYRVTRPTLTGVGERAHLASPAVTLDTHIEDIVKHIETEEFENVILVGHSYGGMVITGVADRLPARLSALVYLDAFVPDDGKSVLDYLAAERRSGLLREGEGTGMVSCMPIPMLGLTNDADRAWVTRRVTRQPYASFAQPIRLERAGGAGLPRTYVYCTETASHTFDQFSARIAVDATWRYVELKAGHDVMIAEPAAVAKVLSEAAAALQQDTDKKPG
jgi:pimeloyl-ACP methyl ester carboxylesterase